MSLFYKRFVYSDLKGADTPLENATAQIDLKLWANNYDQPITVYTLLSNVDQIDSVVMEIEELRKAGLFNNGSDLELLYKKYDHEVPWQELTQIP